MMGLTKQTFIERWIHIIKDWVDLRLKKTKGQLPRTIILRQKIGKGCILLNLERCTPGAICTWRFNGELLNEQSLLITLDNIADLDRYLQRSYRQRNPANTAREVVNLPGRGSSHRIAVSLINPLKRTEFIGVWDANFIDYWSTQHAEDYKAERIILYTARRVMASYEIMPEFFSKDIRSREWWEQRIKHICKGEFQDNHEVNLTFRPEVKSIAR